MIASPLTICSFVQHDKASVHFSFVAFVFEGHGVYMTSEAVRCFVEVDLMVCALEGP